MESAEIEIKLDLKNERNYHRILSFLSSDSKPVRQENHFFDTQDFSLARVGWALRIRRQADRAIFTAKGPRDQKYGELAVRPEIEEDISTSKADRLIESVVDLSTVPRRIADAVGDLTGERKLTRILSFINYRTTVKKEFGGVVLALEIDHTVFPDGTSDYELEVEIDRADIFQDRLDKVADILSALEIPLIFQKETKLARALKRV
jgi:uncharacterized protein YjbK